MQDAQGVKMIVEKSTAIVNKSDQTLEIKGVGNRGEDSSNFNGVSCLAENTCHFVGAS